MQNFDHEFHRRIIVVVKDYLEMAGLGLNIGHWNSAPLIGYHFGISALDHLPRLERNKNKVTTPACKSLKGPRRKRAFARHARLVPGN
jgi:hypothetical protein